MIRLIRLAWLLVVWLALWGEISVANVASGLLVGGAAAIGFDTWRDGELVIRPVRAAHFAGYFAFQLLVSSLTVARTVIMPRGRIHTAVVAVPLQGCTDAVATVLADAITLTPGTLTLEVRREPLTLFVHCLDARDADAVRADVRQLEILAVRAFGGAEALAGLEVDDTKTWRTR